MFSPFAFPCRIECHSLLREAVPALALFRPLANVASRLREVLVGGLTDDLDCFLGRSGNFLFVPDAAEVYPMLRPCCQPRQGVSDRVYTVAFQAKSRKELFRHSEKNGFGYDLLVGILVHVRLPAVFKTLGEGDEVLFDAPTHKVEETEPGLLVLCQISLGKFALRGIVLYPCANSSRGAFPCLVVRIRATGTLLLPVCSRLEHDFLALLVAYFLNNGPRKHEHCRRSSKRGALSPQTIAHSGRAFWSTCQTRYRH